FNVTREIKVIPNFINLEEYTGKPHDCSKRVYAPAGEKVMIHVSNFRKVKRVEDVLRVFQKVREKLPVKLILVGDGPERTNVERLCRELDTCSDIRSLGKLTSPEQVLAIADLFLLTSETESFGLAALEAMAAHVPVISTNTGGQPEVNIHGVTGYLSNVGDIEDMAQNAVKILSDEAVLSRFKDNAYEQAKKFDIHHILPMYEELYESLLKKEPVRA
ncbi:MAG TPA: glycosyltransferase, partial [Bacteroidia bacterium]|nr:glycosyltransferase [Bacteroidia bacterium]